MIFFVILVIPITLLLILIGALPAITFFSLATVVIMVPIIKNELRNRRKDE